MESNSSRFIACYNEIDNLLRVRYGFSERMTYSDVVRKSADFSELVRRHESDLIAYGRLRNAIVHDSLGDDVIAEPNDKTVNKFEKIVDLIKSPPKISVMEKIPPVYATPNQKLIDAVTLMYDKGYSNLPVCDGKKIYGLITARHIIYTLGRLLTEGIDVEAALKSKYVSDVVFAGDVNKIYALLPKSATLDKVAEAFENNRKLAACIITLDGTDKGKPLGIFTSVDVIKIKRLLETY